MLRITPPHDTEHLLSGRPARCRPRCPGRPGSGESDEHVFPGGPCRVVSGLADPEAGDPAGALGHLARCPASQGKIPLLPADTPAHQGDGTSDSAGYEDHCDDDDSGHDRSPYFWPAVMWSASSVLSSPGTGWPGELGIWTHLASSSAPKQPYC